jgi:hypothetical protein
MDKIFKIGLLVLGFSFLAYLFCPVANQVGRYQYYEGSDAMSVLDTSTGLVYRTSYLQAQGEIDIVEWGKDKTGQLRIYENIELRKAARDIMNDKHLTK